MAKEKMTITIDPAVLADADAAAKTAGLNRSGYVERVLRHEHYRRLLASVSPAQPTVEDERELRRMLAWQRDIPTGDQPRATSPA